MSNTSLKPITIPKLNTSNFGQAIKEAFENIDLNFQKLSNLGLNQGAPGRSCIYIPINLGAAFAYNAYTQNDKKFAKYYNYFLEWEKTQLKKLENDDDWKKYKAVIDRDYEQFHTATGYDKQEYARIACILLWGNPSMFGFSREDGVYKSITASPDSLAGALHERYEKLEGPAEIADSGDVTGANKEILYGNWLYELYRIPDDSNLYEEYFKMFYSHWKISSVGKLIVAFSPDSEQGALQPVGSFEYWYIDPRYRCGKEVIGKDSISDISCVLRWESSDFAPGSTTRWNGSFKILEIFPTIRVGEDGRYYWYINGLNTGVPVQGEPGKDGNPGQMVVVERIENVTGWSPDFPNGKDFASPKGGPQTIMVPTYSGAPSRVTGGYVKRLDDNMQMVVDRDSTVEKTFQKQYTIATDVTGRLSSFTFDEKNPWLSSLNTEYENFDDIAYLFRIFRIVGREKFWTYDYDSEDGYVGKIKIKDDEWGRAGDPSCDEFYFGTNGISHVDPNSDIQKLIKELDGALAIVLPGPAYQCDRTDTSFWFATLRAVKSNITGSYELVAYCSPHAQQTTQLDEHSQAGMMMGFDAYTHKVTSDNRNKPRGLILPIGSVAAATSTPSQTWAAHIIHSDAGGFDSRQDCNGGEYRGIQKVSDENRIFDNGTPRTSDTSTSGNNEFSEVIGKRILHVGSVLDVRALNYAEDFVKDGVINGGVPGRAMRKEEKSGSYEEIGSEKFVRAIGSANFFGKNNANNWFEGSELHVDEPVTITRYRDLKAKGRLLDVEGDTVIGPHTHKNIPNIKYRYRSGGLWVGSTLTEETTADDKLFENSIFTQQFIEGGVALEFESFTRPISRLTSDQDTADAARWRSKLGRWRGTRSIYGNSTGVLKGNSASTIFDKDNPLFSAVFDDTIGARMLIVEDGFAVYNPAFTASTVKVYDNNGKHIGNKYIHIPFSVDAFGNIQTYGREIRSNSFDTAWWFHTKWTNKTVSAPSGHVVGNGEGLVGMNLLPRHNALMFGSGHEIQYAQPGHESKIYEQRIWMNPGIGELSNDPCSRPLGYYQTFGFAKDGGSSRPTFAQYYGIGSSYAWGASGFLPTVISMPTDFLWVWGGQLTTGINPYAFRHSFDGGEYGMRFGSTIQYGLYIPNAARQPIASGISHNSNIDHDTYKSGNLAVKYDGTKSLGGESFGLTNMFNGGELECPVGLWLEQGAVIEKVMIAGGDILGYQALSVRGQARAKSFRRHKNALNLGSEWAFMLDDGKSSLIAPEMQWDADEPQPLEYLQASPLNMDMGEFFGPYRLTKFGYTSKLSYDSGTKKIGHTNNYTDREISLLAVLPFSNLKRRSSGYLFAKDATNDKYLAYNAELSCLFNICTLQITINIDKMYKSYDNWHGGALHIGSKRRQYAYGISNGDFGSYDEGGNWVFGGKKGPIAHYRHPNNKGVIKFDGFKTDELFKGLGYLKPTTKVWQFIGSTHGGGDSCAWYNNRDYQYGMWICLNEAGQLESPIYNGNGALFDTPTKLTLTFVWIPSLKGTQKRVYVGTSAVDKDVDGFTVQNSRTFVDTPDGKTADQQADEYIDSIRTEWTTKVYTTTNEAKQQYKGQYNGQKYYIWRKVETINNADVTDSGWMLEDMYYWERVTYHKSTGKSFENAGTENETPIPDGVQTDITSTYNDVISKVGTEYETEEDAYKALTSLVNRYLWSYTLSQTGNKLNNPVWDLLYEWVPDMGTGLFAQNTKKGLFGLTGSNLFDGNSKKIPDGIFRRMGIFTDTNSSINPKTEYVNQASAKPARNAFSVQYWEEGKTSFLRLNIACDMYWKGEKHMYAKVWGISIPGENDLDRNRTYTDLGTLAYLPVGAKLPRCAVRAQLAGAGSGWSNWKDNRPVYGGGRFMLDIDGRIYIEHINNPRALVSVTEPWTYMPVVSIVFTYPSSSEEMKQNFYDEMMDIGEVPDIEDLPNIPETPGTGDDDNSDDDWMWSSTAEPDTTSLLTWLKGDGRISLKDAIVEAFDSESNDARSMVAPYGQATIEKTGSIVKVSLWVTSNGPSGLTHRSINFTATKSGDPFIISGLTSVLLEKNFNPGYYKSTQESGNKPVDPSYIGTTQTESSSTTWPYIWYTNDGKSWTLIDAPIVLDPNYYHVLSTEATTIYKDPSNPLSYERIVPAGILATFNADGSANIYNGKSNYFKTRSLYPSDGWPSNTDTDGNPINELNTIQKIVNSAAPGVLSKKNGFAYCFRIHRNNWSQAGVSNAANWSTFEVAGLSSTSSWEELSKLDISSIRISQNTFWVAENGQYVYKDGSCQGPSASLNIGHIKNGNMETFTHWVEQVLMFYLIGSQWYGNWKSRKYSMYSVDTGYSGYRQDIVIRQNIGIGYINMRTEQTVVAPVSDSGAGAGCQLKADFGARIQFNDITIQGAIHIIVGGFDRTGMPGTPVGAKYLTCAFNNCPGKPYWPISHTPDSADQFSLPVISKIVASLIWQDGAKLYKVQINSDDNTCTCEEIGSGTGTSVPGPQGPTGKTPEITMTAKTDNTSLDTPTVDATKGGTTDNPTFELSFKGLKGKQGSGGTVDTSALESRIAALEDMIRMITTSPEIITVNVPAGQSSVDVEIREYKSDGTEVEPDNLDITTESGLTHNG